MTVTDTSASDTSVPSGPSQTELLERSLAPRFRSTCGKAHGFDVDNAATSALSCDVPGADYTLLESFPSRASMFSAFGKLSGGFDHAACPDKWKPEGSVLTTWYTGKKSNTRGKLACYWVKPGYEIGWTDNQRNNAGFLGANDQTQLFDAWVRAAF